MDLNQITVDVHNLDEGIAFYRRLGLRLIVHSADSRYARFELPSGSTTLSLHENPVAQPNETVLYFEADELARRFEELVSAGVNFETGPTHESWRWQRRGSPIQPAISCAFFTRRRSPLSPVADRIQARMIGASARRTPLSSLRGSIWR